MVIWVNGFLGPQLTAKDFDGTVRDDLHWQHSMTEAIPKRITAYLVHIHVALGATSGLEDDQRKVIDKRSTDHLGASMGVSS